jgi:serine protease
MKRFAAILLAGGLVACQDQNAPGPSENVATPQLSAVRMGQGPEQVVPGRVLLKLQSGISPDAVIAPHGLTVAGRGHGNAFLILQGAAPGNERAIAARLRADSRVIYAEPDYLRQPTVDSRLWAFFNPGGLQILFTSGPSKGSPVSDFVSVADADEDNVDGYASGGGDVVIGSIDTGVDFGHTEFLAGQLIAGTDWYSSDNDPTDENGHGTHTTGTMAGRTVGVAGVSGAGSHVKVYVQRVCGQRGCPTSATASAIRAAADFGVVAMNLSLGGSSESAAEAEAIAYATSKNALVIASAGNGSTGTVECPACDPNAISVAASNWQDALTYYTNWGPGLDITAPGGQMYSNTTEESGIYSSYLGGGYRYLQGTSMSAPQVTGTAAIVGSVSGLRGSALRARILGSADDLGAAGYDTQFGCGRLDSYRAVTGNTPPGEPAGGTVASGAECGGTGSTLTASFSSSCHNSATCNFDGTSSTGATSWDWDFGDTGSGTGSTATHTYGAAGSYNVVLTVGNGSSTATASHTITCTANRRGLRCH